MNVTMGNGTYVHDFFVGNIQGQLRIEHEGDPSPARLLEWVQERQQPDYAAISNSGHELMLMHSQWASLTIHNRVLYRRWRRTSGHFGIAKTLQCLRKRFYWSSCCTETELSGHRCGTCASEKGPSQRPQFLFNGHFGLKIFLYYFLYKDRIQYYKP